MILKNRKIKVKFFTVADYMEEQQWLSTQQQKGWQLFRIVPPCIFIFEKCTPQEMVYKLEYQQQSITEDYIQMYQDYGWEYCGDCMKWQYFRKLKKDVQFENDAEIFSNAQSKIDMITSILIKRMIPAFIFLIGASVLRNLYYSTKYIWMDIVVFVLYSYVFIKFYFKLKTMRKELE